MDITFRGTLELAGDRVSKDHLRRILLNMEQILNRVPGIRVHFFEEEEDCLDLQQLRNRIEALEERVLR